MTRPAQTSSRPRRRPPRRPPAPDTRNLAARRCALDALTAVFTRGAALDAALDGQPAYRKLEPRDRAFARAIAAAAVRRCGSLDAAVDAFLSKPLPAETRARRVLRLAAAELLVLEGAAHAAVDAAVALMGEAREDVRYKGLANAVLRKIASAGPALLAQADPLVDLPEWLSARWCSAYGEETARAMTAAAAAEPPLDLTLKPGELPADWAVALDAAVLPTGTLRRAKIGDVTALPGFDDGAWWVQDAAAALPAHLLRAQPGERVADLCAAPGGKTLQLAATGARVTALDRSEARLGRVRENLARTGLTAEIVAADARRWTPEQPFDAILLDAPCSATGTLRRRPDVAWSKSEADIQSLARLQDELIQAAAAMLSPGGRLLYCTCSLEPDEGEQRIEAALAHLPDLGLDPLTPDELPGLEHAIAPQGWLRTRPDTGFSGVDAPGALDGFFAARLVRKA
jgi:16S rRNA (cytosine967-C5)-methyltransferase